MNNRKVKKKRNKSQPDTSSLYARRSGLILYEGVDSGSTLLALRDTFGPNLADLAWLLFTPEGEKGRPLGRSAILKMRSTPARARGPYRVIIWSILYAGDALERLRLMNEMHGYGKVAEPLERRNLKRYFSKGVDISGHLVIPFFGPPLD